MKSFYDKDTRRLSTGQPFFCLIYQRISIVSYRLKMLLSKLYSEIFRTPWEIIGRNLGCTPAEFQKDAAGRHNPAGCILYLLLFRSAIISAITTPLTSIHTM